MVVPHCTPGGYPSRNTRAQRTGRPPLPLTLNHWSPLSEASRAAIRNGRAGISVLCKKPTIFFSGAEGEGLECSDHAENIINRKIGTFYMEAIPPKIFQLRQKIFFRAR